LTNILNDWKQPIETQSIEKVVKKTEEIILTKKQLMNRKKSQKKRERKAERERLERERIEKIISNYPTSKIGEEIKRIVVKDGDYAGQQIYADPKWWVAVASEGKDTNYDDRRREWRYEDGTIYLDCDYLNNEHKMLYVTKDGWCGMTESYQHPTSVEDSLSKFSYDNGVFSLRDGRQLYIHKGKSHSWMAVAKQDKSENTDKSLRTFEFITHKKPS